jgi:hypothetical protein
VGGSRGSWVVTSIFDDFSKIVFFDFPTSTKTTSPTKKVIKIFSTKNVRGAVKRRKNMSLVDMIF